MAKYLPLFFLISALSFFGIVWIVFDVDPNVATWHFFAIFVVLFFLAIFGFLGTLIFYARTFFLKRYSRDSYLKNSFKIAFFVAIFATIILILDILKLLSGFNAFLGFLAVSLFALYSLLGKKLEE